MIKQVIVIGSGPSGIAVAESILAHGVKVIVLEAGELPNIPEGLNDAAEYRKAMSKYTTIDDHEWLYHTNGVEYTRPRAKAGGGKTLYWGGWMVPPSKESWVDAEKWGRPWPFSLSDLQPYLKRAAVWLNARELEHADSFKILEERLDVTVQPKLAAYGPNNKRPFHPFDRWNRLLHIGLFSMMSNAVCKRLLIQEGKCVGVEYVQDNISEILYADAVVLSASTIETTRLLLASNAENEIADHDLIGRGFMDHISSLNMVVVSRSNPKVQKLLGRKQCGYIPRSSHSEDEIGGYTVELHGPESMDILDPETFAITGISPSRKDDYACFFAFVLGEVAPRYDRYISLHSNAKDSLGRNVPLINFRWHSEDYKMAERMDNFGKAITDTIAAEYGGKSYKIGETLSFNELGANHEAGTCPMGFDPAKSVVNAGGQVHGVPGLYIADSSVLPTSLDCPPTLTLVALAIRTAESVIADLYIK